MPCVPLLQLYHANPVVHDGVRLTGDPEHVEGFVGEIEMVGLGFTTTIVVIAGLICEPIVIVKEYVPAIAGVTFGLVGFITFEVNPPGPVQLYVAPGGELFAVSCKVCPIHNGPLFSIGGGRIPQSDVPLPVV